MDDKFRERFTLARKLRKKRLQEIADICGISLQAAAQWGQGKSKPKPDRLRDIAKWLQVSERWLAWGDGDMDSGTTATNGTQRTEPSIIGIDSTRGRQIPLIALEDFPVEETTSGNTVTPNIIGVIDTKYPCGARSRAFIVGDRSMEPRITVGDTVVIDPDLDAVPEDLVVVEIVSQRRVVFRQLSLGDDGAVILRPFNPHWEQYTFTAAEWRSNARLLGVMSERTEPRRT